MNEEEKKVKDWLFWLGGAEKHIDQQGANVQVLICLQYSQHKIAWDLGQGFLNTMTSRGCRLILDVANLHAGQKQAA